MMECFVQWWIRKQKIWYCLIESATGIVTYGSGDNIQESVDSAYGKLNYDTGVLHSTPQFKKVTTPIIGRC